MNAQPTAPESLPTAQPTFSIRNVLLLAVPLVLISGGVYFYLLSDAKSQAKPLDFLAHIKRALNPSTKLNEGLADTDGDLVADAPTDEKLWLDPDVLVFSVLGPDLEKENERWKDFVVHLEQVTGKKVELVSAVPSQGVSPAHASQQLEQQVADMRDGKTHIASMSTGTVSAAVNEGGIVPLFVMASADGNYGYEMEVIVRAKTDIKKPSDLKGKSISFANVSSHSGFKAPLVILSKEFGLMPERDYLPRFSGDQEHLIQQVAGAKESSQMVDDKIEAAPVASDLLRRMVSRGDADANSFRSIYKSEKFPPACYGVIHQLKPDLVAKIKDAFTNFKWEGTSLGKAYEAADQVKFVPISYKDDWKSVREIEKSLQEMLTPR